MGVDNILKLWINPDIQTQLKNHTKSKRKSKHKFYGAFSGIGILI